MPRPPSPPPQAVTCRRCGALVDGSQVFCPNCGFRLIAKSPRKLISAVLAVFLCGGPSLFLGACLSGLGQMGGSSNAGTGPFFLGGIAIAVVLVVYAIYELVAYCRK